MSRSASSWKATLNRFPRVSGDEPLSEDVCEGRPQFSPRERG